ncbi:MAG: toxin-antitoxin system HicB family antitoxin [Pirellulales bacterium]
MLEAQQAHSAFSSQDNQEEKRRSIRSQANQRFSQHPDWVTFYREVLGINGVIRQNFPDAQTLASFEKTEEYADIQQMLAKLREKGRTQVSEQEPTRVITVRMPKSLHESLRVEAHERHTSMNKLCISKLLQMIDTGLVPHEV